MTHMSIQAQLKPNSFCSTSIILRSLQTPVQKRKCMNKSLYHDTSPSLPKFCMASSSDPIAMLDSSTAYFKFCTPRSWMPKKGIPFYCLVHRDPYIMASKNPYKSGRIPVYIYIYIHMQITQVLVTAQMKTQPESMESIRFTT